VTLQNYFRLYEKLGGMTGTAETEAGEFAGTTAFSVVPIPTNKPLNRLDEPDLIFKSEEAKFNAVADDLEERREKGQPVLVGTASVAKSELLSRLLDQRGVPHEVLNAKQHFREAEIVAQAGRLGSVTVATNMAGRGVDIILGGNPELLAVHEAHASGIDVETDEGGPARRPEDEFEERCASGGRRRARGGGSTCSARSDTRAAASTTSCVVVPGARAIPREPLLPEPRRRLDAAVRHRGDELGDGAGPPRGRPHRGEDGDQGHRAGAEHGRGRNSETRRK